MASTSSTTATTESSEVSADCEETETETDQSSSVTSFLSVLGQPAPSDLARKRIIQRNPPPSGAKRCRGAVQNEPKSIRASERVKEYPDELLVTSPGNKLFCSGCRETVSLKKSVINMHIKSAKHNKMKQAVLSKKSRDVSIVEALKCYDRSEHPIGETLSDDTRVFRVNVVTTFLKAGIPLEKIDMLRELLEEGGRSLTSSSHLRQLIPFVLNQELERLKKMIAGRAVSVIFDGTTHVAEAFVVVLRFIDDEWTVHQKVAQLLLLEKSLTGEEVARLLVEVLSAKLGIVSNLVVAAMRDRASVNNVAMRTVAVLYNCIMDVGCFSHTLDHVGEKMCTPNLDKFIRSWIQMFSHSPKTRLAWTSQTGLSPPSYSATRWWSKFEVMHKVHDAFGDVVTFLDKDDLPPATSGKLLAILNDAAKCRKLKMELAMTVDSMLPFVKATYELEGDGLLALSAYRQISKLYTTISAQNFPNVKAIARKESNGNALNERQLIDYANVCVQPAYEYFKLKFDNTTGELKNLVLAFKAARFFSPWQMNEIKPSAADADSVKCFPFVDDNLLQRLKDELPTYQAAVEDVSPEINIQAWWKSHEGEIPAWSKACKLVLLVQPSSAAAERVFSLLQNSFNGKQTRALEDYVSASVMMQYNS